MLVYCVCCWSSTPGSHDECFGIMLMHIEAYESKHACIVVQSYSSLLAALSPCATPLSRHVLGMAHVALSSLL